MIEGDLFRIENIVCDKLRALADECKFDYYEIDIPVGTNRPNVDHAINPYVIIDFSNRGQQGVEHQGITGTRDNIKYITVVFEIVANNPSTVRQIASIIDDNFMGYSPDPTWGEFVNRVAAPMYSRQPPEATEFFPPRYYRTIAYVVDVDA